MEKKPMPKIMVVTNRQICQENFLGRIEELAKTQISSIILREKDLPEEKYEALAKEVLMICRRYKKECILHSFPDVALRLGEKSIHLPLWKAAGYKKLHSFNRVGVSVHSVEEAKQAKALGAAYVTAGHVFTTDCKPDLSPRGLSFLQNVCGSIPIPVFAIGGINEDNMDSVLQAGADGICLMSSMMRCSDPPAYVDRLCFIAERSARKKLIQEKIN